MKRVFVNVASNMRVRNYLRSGFLAHAKAQTDIEWIFFATAEDCEALTKEFGDTHCLFEPIPDHHVYTGKWYYLWQIILHESIHTRTIWLRQRYPYIRGGSFLNFLAKRTIYFLGQFRWWRAFLRFVEYQLLREDRVWNVYFECYKPDLVFATALMVRDDPVLLKAAKRRGIRTVGMVQSWDNLTSKLFLNVFPDMLLVQNPMMVDEAVVLHDFPRDRICVTGFLQWNHYHDPRWHMDKDELGTILGLDATKPWVSYFSGPPFTQALEQFDYGDHLVMLINAVEQGTLPDVQLVASIHPIDEKKIKFVPEAKSVPRLDIGRAFQFSVDEMKVLANFIRHSAVLINFGSSVALEAAIYDVPIIMLGFNGYNDAEVPWEGRLDVAFDNTTHSQNVEKSGGVWRVGSEQEYIKAVQSYLENPSLHHEGRTHLVEQLVGPVDGKAAERVLSKLLRALKV